MNRFDRIIKNKVEHVESAYPQDIWQKIHEQLPKKKKRFPGLWFFVSFLLMAAVGLLFMVSRNEADPVAGGIMPAKPESVSSYTTGGQKTNPSSGNAFSGLSSTRAVDQSGSPAIQNLSSNMEAGREVASGSSKYNGHKYGLPRPVMPGHVFAQHSKTEDSNIIESEMSNEKDAGNIEGMQRAAVFQPQLESDYYHVFGTDQSDVIEEINHTMKKHALMKCPTFVRKENVSWLEVYFSNDYAIRSLEPKNAEARAYADAREKTEKPYLSYSAGIRLGMGWNNGVAFKSGVNYSRINEKFTYTDPNSMQIKTITIIKYIYDDQFNIIDSVKTTENVSIPGANTVTNYNHISFIDIPVLFQYTMPGRKRLSYSATLGPYINVGITQSGKILNKEGNSLISLDNADLIKRNIGLSFYGSFAINYQLTRNIQIAFEPNFRYIPSSLTNLSYPLEQKYFLANVAAAFKYKI